MRFFSDLGLHAAKGSCSGLFLCVISMLSVIGSYQVPAIATFMLALGLMALSLGCLIYEVWISGGALRILLNAVEEESGPRQ